MPWHMHIGAPWKIFYLVDYVVVRMSSPNADKNAVSLACLKDPKNLYFQGAP